MFDKSGRTYRWAWRSVWPLLRSRIAHTKAEYALAIPARKQDEPWWEFHLYENVRRVISRGTGGVATILLGVVSIAMTVLIAIPTILPGVLGDAISPLLRASIILAAMAIVLAGAFYFAISAVCYGAYTALRAAPPDEYARFVLAGRSIPDLIRVTAFEIRAVCEAFLADCRDLEMFQDTHRECYQGDFNGWDMHTFLLTVRERDAELRAHLKIYKKRLPAYHEALSRLMAMKKTLATDLGVSHRRLCDHILAYRPVLHRTLAIKFAENWETMLEATTPRYSDIGTAFPRRLRGMLLQNARIIGHAKRAVVRQTQLIGDTRNDVAMEEHDQLLAAVHRFISQGSSSGSAIQYCWAIHFVAQAALRRLSPATGNPLTPAEVEVMHQTAEKLDLLYKHQRAYPGVELHKTCIRILEGVGDLQGHVQLLRILPSALSGLRARWESTTTCLEARRDLEQLVSLPMIVEGLITENRDQISKAVSDHIEAFFGQMLPDGRAFVLTVGYSKTIRNALRSVTGMHLRVIVVLAAEDDHDGLRMVFELAEMAPGRGEQLNVGRGREDSLHGLLKPGDRVLIMLGAECFDRTCSVVHPRVSVVQLDKIDAMLDESGCQRERIAVAERYKELDDVLGDRLLFRYHLQHTCVYKVDKVITESEVLSPPTTGP